MVKGISRQVIVVQNPDKELFEQAIFILKDSAVQKGGITDEMLLKEARKMMGNSAGKKRKLRHYGFLWALCGSAMTGFMWLICALL